MDSVCVFWVDGLNLALTLLLRLRSRLQAEGLTEGIKSYTLEQATKNFPDIIMGIRENISNTGRCLP